MSGFRSIRRLATAAILLTAAAGAVTLFGQTAPPATSSAPVVSTTGPALPPPTSIPSLDDPIAVINGRPVNNRVFYSIMMQVAGMRVFQQVLDLTLVQDACQSAGIQMEGKEFQDRLQKEAERYMDQLNIPGKNFDERTANLGVVLQQRGATAVEFRIGLETSALLRAMAEPNVKVTPQEVQTEYESDYGERRKVHIISYDTKEVSTLKLKDALRTAKSPEEACTQLKLAPPKIWDIPFNAEEGDPVKTIQNVAFKILKSPKEVSNETDVKDSDGQMRTVLVILDEITPDRRTQPGNSLAVKRDECEKKLVERRQGQWMNNHLAFLRSKAVVEIKDPTLAAMYQQIADAIKRAAAQAATQPGGAGTAPASSAAPATGAATGRGR